MGKRIDHLGGPSSADPREADRMADLQDTIVVSQGLIDLLELRFPVTQPALTPSLDGAVGMALRVAERGGQITIIDFIKTLKRP